MRCKSEARIACQVWPSPVGSTNCCLGYQISRSAGILWKHSNKKAGLSHPSHRTTARDRRNKKLEQQMVDNNGEVQHSVILKVIIFQTGATAL